MQDRPYVQRREYHHPAGGKEHLHTVAGRKGNQGPRRLWEGDLGCPLWGVAGEVAGRAPGEGASGPFSGGISRTVGDGGR